MRNEVGHTWCWAFFSNGFLIGHPCMFICLLSLYCISFTFIHLVRNESLSITRPHHSGHTATFFKFLMAYSCIFFLNTCIFISFTVGTLNLFAMGFLLANCVFSFSVYPSSNHVFSFYEYLCCTRCAMNLYFP